MAQTEVLMPKMGESVIEATIIKWTKNEGDKVKADETLLEIATDKVDSEIPAPSDGILVKKLCKEGDVIPVGKAIAIISTDAVSATVPVSAPVAESKKAAPVSAPVQATSKVETKKELAEPVSRFSDSGRFYSPLVRSIAQKEGIPVNELETIPGSGKAGRVTKNDIISYLPARQANGSAEVAKPIVQETINTAKIEAPAKPMVVGANDEIIEMDRMRKLIADHMVMSKRVSPHVTSYVETDVTNLVLWREKIKKEFEKKEGEKLTFTPLFIEATVKALKDYPMVNVSVDGTRIIRHKDIHIGMAVALPSGNLIVPVIKYADRNSLLGITKQVNDLAGRARINKLVPDDTNGGTFTITNVGTFGNIMGTPIINQPQAAILATGIIKKKPVVLETSSGDVIAIRHMMYLSLSYDHRVVDGALGGSFLKRVSDYLEQFDINRNTW
ncbi:MAG TPA: dihydrolipoamide acetyltransferase family protein [Bacteroidia bacterium]|jgi:2-oxoglutarate dehydrogenase E2 component (dihydrolipoamide succinyltransferase)|nr:dihydrolipoamide acetyltransferase family protein [Bacteroidia bacterium]